MGDVCISRNKLGQVIADVERLITDVENLIEDQNQIVEQRLKDVKQGKIEAKTEQELDDYLKKRGVKAE